jgi:hypothetical protein
MKAVNRCVIVIKPKTPFLDWVNRTDESGVVLTLDEIGRDCTTYLMPEVGYDEELREFVELNYPLLFEQELAGWVWDEDEWPAKRSLHTFLEWFDVEFHSEVIDLAEGELLVTEDEF